MRPSRESLILNFICNKFYRVETFDGRITAGFMINYYCGNIVLLIEGGVCHIPNGDIVNLYPYQPKMEKFSEEYQQLIFELLRDDEESEVNVEENI